MKNLKSLEYPPIRDLLGEVAKLCVRSVPLLIFRYRRMSLHLIPQSRRRFLAVTSAAGILAMSPDRLWATPAETGYWALLADTHIAGDAATIARGVNMVDNLNQIIDEILAEPIAPDGVIINGDCAYLKGLRTIRLRTA